MEDRGYSYYDTIKINYKNNKRGISMDFKYCKLEIFLPPSHLEVLQKALQEVDAGHIDNYDSCMSVSPVTVTASA